jgi:hypothetical protein
LAVFSRTCYILTQSKKVPQAVSILFLLSIVPLSSLCALTPEAVAEQFEKALSAIVDYQCRLYEYAWQGSDFEEKTIDFYFKKPRLIRVDVLKSSKPGDAGSQGVSLDDGKVTGRRGGILSFLAVTFGKHEPLVTTIRGMALDEGDMRALAVRIRRGLIDGTCRLLEHPGVYEFVLQPRSSPPCGPVTKEVIRLDAGSLLPLSADGYEGERIVEHAAWTGYVLNAGLPLDLFDVHWDLGRLSRMGVLSVHGVP